MKVFRQLVKEFWIQVLISLVWTLYKLYIKKDNDEALSIVITSFFPSLLSWFFGQYLRIQKQQKIENDFTAVFKELKTLIEKVDNSLTEIVNHVNGGDSVCYLKIAFANSNQNVGICILSIEGKYTVYRAKRVQVRIRW